MFLDYLRLIHLFTNKKPLPPMCPPFGAYCQAQLRLQLQLQFDADFALFSFYPPPTHHQPIRTSSDFNSNFSLCNFQARAMLGSSLASW